MTDIGSAHTPNGAEYTRAILFLSQYNFVQHQIIQLLLRKFEIVSIAELTGKSTRIIRVQILNIRKKCGHNEHDACLKLIKQHFDIISDDDYFIVSNGLAKDWAMTY